MKGNTDCVRDKGTCCYRNYLHGFNVTWVTSQKHRWFDTQKAGQQNTEDIFNGLWATENLLHS